MAHVRLHGSQIVFVDQRVDQLDTFVVGRNLLLAHSSRHQRHPWTSFVTRTYRFKIRLDASKVSTTRATGDLGRILDEQFVQAISIVSACIDQLEADNLGAFLGQ